MGPDLMAWLRLSNGRLLLLVIQANCRLNGHIDTVSADVTAHAIRSLIPNSFFAPKKGETSETPALLRQQGIDAMLAAINELNEKFTTGRADAESAMAEDNHALALLPRSTLASALATSPDGRSIVSMLTSALKRTRGELDDDAEDGQPSQKSRRTGGE